MRYRLRQRWPVVVGLLAGPVALLAFGPGLTSWAVWATGLLVGLAVQGVVSSRIALSRERRLVTTAATLRSAGTELERLAQTDALTGLRNRRAFDEALGVEIRRARRYGRDLSLLMIDLDDFKVVNDRGGHLYGDHVLAVTARLIAEHTRESDIVARYGGEEFAVLLPETDGPRAEVVAKKLLDEIAASEVSVEGDAIASDVPRHVSVSIGCASLAPGDTDDERALVRQADEALYEAKRAGKGQVHRAAARI
ncbi:MAG: GGDEF domain-containing protein [Dehalococcoidia bacterium]